MSARPLTCRESKPAPQSWAVDGLSQAEALRCRCRVVVLMQRTCDAMHAQSARHMPLAAQLQLLSVLQARLRSLLCSSATDVLFFITRSSALLAAL